MILVTFLHNEGILKNKKVIDFKTRKLRNFLNCQNKKTTCCPKTCRMERIYAWTFQDVRNKRQWQGKDRWADSAGEFRSDALPTRVLYSAADQITQVEISNRRAFLSNYTKYANLILLSRSEILEFHVKIFDVDKIESENVDWSQTVRS